MTPKELELFVAGCGGVVLVGRLSALAGSEARARMLVCARAPYGRGSRKCTSAVDLFRAVGWPHDAATKSGSSGCATETAAETATSSVEDSSGATPTATPQQSALALPYECLVPPAEVGDRVFGRDGCPEEFPPVCTAYLTFPTRGPRKSATAHLRAACNKLSGTWVQAVAVPRAYSFVGRGARGEEVRRRGVRLELAYVSAFEPSV